MITAMNANPKKASWAADDPCHNAGSKQRFKVIICTLTVLIMALRAFPYMVPHVFACGACALLFLDDDKAKRKIATVQVVLRIQNMNCRSCPNAVEQSLLKVEGVFDVLVALRPPRAFVTYDPLSVRVEQLTEAAEKAGFPSIADKTAVSPRAHTPYLYYVLLPVLVLLIVLTFIFYKRWKNQAINMCLEPSRNIVLKRGKVEK